ncbi:hypothetical protein JW905_13105 [bacterium]|nr:hypothetical protein [candidate division CSSED10-310 bacterium]
MHWDFDWIETGFVIPDNGTNATTLGYHEQSWFWFNGTHARQMYRYNDNLGSWEYAFTYIGSRGRSS